MAKSVNKVTLLGTLGRDADMKFTTNGKAVTNFSVATSYGFGDKEETTWTDVTLWDAEKLTPYLLKGTKVYVEGRLTNRSFEDKNGNKVFKTFVTANEIVLCSSKQQSSSNQSDDSNGDDVPF